MTQALAAGTNRSFHHTITTSAAASRVWRLWTDTTTWQDWDLGLKSAAMEGEFALGSTGQLTPKSGPKSRFKITAFEPGASYTFSTRLPLARLLIRRSFDREHPTIFRHHVSFHGPLAGVWARILGPGFRRDLPPTMERIAELAEAQVPA